MESSNYNDPLGADNINEGSAEWKKHLQKRGICFVLECYIEDDNWQEPIRRACYYGDPYLYIVHDKDSAKCHVHILVRLPNSQTVSAFSKNFLINPRFVQPCKIGWKNFVIYMIHADYQSKFIDKKHQYDIHELHGSLLDSALVVIKNHRLEVKNNSSDEPEVICRIVNYIESQNDILSTANLVRWCCSVGVYSYYRRSASIINQILKDHNSRFARTIEESILNVKLRNTEEKLNHLEKRNADLEYEISSYFGDFDSRQRVPSFLDRPVDVDLIKSWEKGVDK